jgi:hypothetical protein
MNTDAFYTFLSTTGAEIAVKVLAAIAFWIVGRWLIGKVVSLLQAVMSRNALDPTLTKYMGSIVAVALNIALVLGILGYFGIQTTSIAAMLAGAGVAIGMAWSGLLAHFAAGAFLRRSHDAVGPAGDGHVALFHHSPGELKRQLVVRIVGGCAGGAEHADFQTVPIALKYPKGMPQFLECPIDDLEVEHVELRFGQPDHTRENFLHERGLNIVVGPIQQGGDLCEYFVFGRGRFGTSGRGLHEWSPTAR